MAHAEHFLSRLSRLSPDQEELSLGLYRDASMVREILRLAPAPEGAERIALALSDDREPPHILVSREGAFITCLAGGMKTDLPVITYPRMHELRLKVIALRELFDRAHAAAAEPGVGRAGAKIIQGGSAVTAEDMRISMAIVPLWGGLLVKAFGALADEMISLRKELHRWPHAERWVETSRGEEKLRRFWQAVWGVSHLAILLSSGQAAADPEKRVHETLSNMFVEALKTAFLPMALRLAWVMGQGGKVIYDHFERKTEGSDPGPVELFFSAIPIAVLGNSDPALHQRAQRFFSSHAARETDDMFARLATMAGASIVDPRGQDAFFVRQGRDLVWEGARQQKHFRWSSPDHIPERLARAIVADYEISMFLDRPTGEFDGYQLLAASAPWLAKATAEELYLPAAEVVAGDHFNMDAALHLLEGSRALHPRPSPKLAKAEPGRNELCPCGSGKKFKKCHAQ